MPNTISFDRDLDTLATSALDYYSGRPHDCIHDGGEKFLRTLLERGRVMAIPHTEYVFHDVVYDHGQNTSYYPLDGTGTFADIDSTTQAALATTPTEVLTSARFTVAAGTRNIVLEQSMPAGNRIDQINTRVKANMSKIFNEEEQLLLLGQTAVNQAASGQTYMARGAVAEDTANSAGGAVADSSYVAGLPMSLLQFFQAENASVTGGLKPADIANWKPEVTALADGGTATLVSSASNYASVFTLLNDIQKEINVCGYSEEEHTTHVWVSRLMFQLMVQAMIEKGALPDPVRADLGNPWNYKIPFGGVEICWSRYLTQDDSLHVLDAAAGSAADAVEPIFGLNMDTFRYNIATDAADMTAEGLPGFIKQVGPIIPMVDKTNVFKRIAFSRCLSIENGRRSSFAILDRRTS